MARDIKLMGEVLCPPESDKHDCVSTLFRIYWVDIETRHFIAELDFYENHDYDPIFWDNKPVPQEVIDARCVKDYVLDLLDITEDWDVAPGALYHRFEVSFNVGYLIVSDSAAYNV